MNPFDGHTKEGAPNPDGTYEIERVLSAKWSKKADDYLMKVKWKGWSKPTEETRWFLLNPDNCSDEEIHEQVREVIRRTRRGKGVPDEDNRDHIEILTDESDDDGGERVEGEGVVDGGTDQIMLLCAADDEYDYCEFLRRRLAVIRHSL